MVATDAIRDLHLGSVLVCRPMGYCHFLLSIGVGQNISLEAFFRVRAIQTNAVRIPTTMVCIHVPSHLNHIPSLINALDRPLGHHLLPCF